MRKLASVQRIKEIIPIEGADLIVLAKVLDWQCVVKKDEFKVGDLCCFFEIDSLLNDEPRYEFLKKSCWRDGINKHRIRSCRLRKQLSQGVAMPLDKFPELTNAEEGFDATEILGVEKWEPPVPAEIQGDVKGGFAWPISKTDEIRVQNNAEYGFIEALWGKPYYITLKLDGTSSTFLIDKMGEFHVCGRNYSYKDKPNHAFWQIEKQYKIEEKLRELYNQGKHIAIQSECIGQSIQANRLGLPNKDIYVFNVVDVPTNTKLNIDDALEITSNLGLKFAPILERGDSFQYSVADCLEKAKGKYIDHFPSAKPQQEREGIIVRSIDSKISFKAISNEFLMKEKDV
jgi:RNA ligase (TIGR02306 family)